MQLLLKETINNELKDTPVQLELGENYSVTVNINSLLIALIFVTITSL